MNRFLIVGLVASLMIAGGLSLFASSFPDGLERVAEDLGFGHLAKEAVSAIAPDYQVPWITNPFVSQALAGIGGTLLVFAVAWGIGRMVVRA